MTDSISTLGLQLINSNNLTSAMTQLSTLNQQLASGVKSSNLSDYSASDAVNLMNFTNSITQRQGFLAVANAVSPRIQVYDSSLTGIEGIAASAESLTSNASIYNPTQNGSTATQIQGFMQQIQYYLNQDVGGRYIFSGSRYGTAPVGDITALPAPTAADISNIGSTVSSGALPAYDSQYQSTATANVESGSMTLTALNSGTLGNGVTITFAAGTTVGTTKATLSVAGQPYTETYDNIAGTGTTLYTNLANAINSGTPPSKLVTATAGSAGVTPTAGDAFTLAGGTGSSQNNVATVAIGSDISFSALNAGTAGNKISVALSAGTVSGTKVIITNGTTTSTYDNIAGTGAALWTNVAAAVNADSSGLVLATTGGGTDAPTAATYNLVGGVDTSASYAQDQVSIDTTQNLKYGVSSNATGFQQLIMGVRLAYAATQDKTNYTADMSQAQGLITQGLTAIRGLHTGVSNANATLTNAQTLQNTTISNLQGQIGDIQNVDVNAVAVKIQTFQASLEASYSATGQMAQLSIVKYL